MSRRAHNQGMSKSVQIALGFAGDRVRPHADACSCGQEKIIGTDRDFLGLVPIGRMIEYCRRCRRLLQLWPGPRMLTREDKEPEFETRINKNGQPYHVRVHAGQGGGGRL